jgi:lipid-binding SYLF domain-containing protein
MRKPIIVTLGVAALFAGPGAGAASADFVCPVLPVSDQAKQNSKAGFITIGGGDTSILPGKAGDSASSPVDVPDRATNQDGAGSPAGAHASPGDPDYTAIWSSP